MSELVKREVQQEEDEEENEDLMENLLDAMEEPEPDNKQEKQEEKEEENEDLMENLLDAMEDNGPKEEQDSKEIEQENKNQEVQRKYWQTLHEIFTDLDLTEIDENGDNMIELSELKNYIKSNNLAVPMYLAENIYYTIDNDHDGFISPIEYLKWKTRVTIDQIGVLTETIISNEKDDDDLNNIDINDLLDDDDLADIDQSISEEALFDVVKIMDEAEEKQEMDDMLVEMEKQAEEKRTQMEKKKKEMEEEERKRRAYAEEQRRIKEEQELKLKKQKQEIEFARRELQEEKNEMERQEKIKKIQKLEEYINNNDKNNNGPITGTPTTGHDHDSDPDDSKSSDDEDFDVDASTDTDWTTDGTDGNDNGAQTTVIEQENTCIKFFPCFKVCSCCDERKVIRQRTVDREKQNGKKDVINVITGAKRKLSRFIYKYGDSYVDDDTMVLSNDRMQRLTKDIEMDSKMGVYFWSLVLDKQSQKAYDCLWPVLRYLGSELPTPVAVELIQLYRVELSRYPPPKIEGITRAIVDSSKFSIATALVLAVFFNERAQKDLANTRLLSQYSCDYQNLAAEELRQVESDYLASMTMKTKSFHSYKTPFKIAVENELIEFLSSDRMGRIGHAMWVKRDLLRPEISENSFEVRATGVLAIVAELPSPRDFYFTPMGFHFTETFLFFIYLGIFTLITVICRPTVYGNNDGGGDKIEWYEWLLFICNFGYIFNEILQFIQEGPGKYFQTWENAIDITVSVIWILIMFLRILSAILITYIPSLSEIDVLSGIEEDDSFLNLLFTALWVINIILLWIRCLHFLMLSNQEGPLINVMISMISSVKNWLWVFVVISVGFVFGEYFLVSDINPYLSTEQRTLSLTILGAFGQPDWFQIQAFGDDGQALENIINSWLIIIYSIVGFVLLINLLIAMMAETYGQTEGQAAKEVLLNRTSLAYELDLGPKIMPPPLNSILFVIFLLYNIIDIIVLAFTSEFLNEQGFSKYWRCRNKDCKFLNSNHIIDEHVKQGWDTDFPCGLCDQLHTMDDIYKSSKRRFRRKARGLDRSKNTFCSRLGHGIKELFVTKTKWKKHSWSCGYCRMRIPSNYSANLNRYFARLEETHNLDQNDVNWIKSMNPQLCPYCYRSRKPRARPTYILENISFIIFLIIIYPIMWFLLWPMYLYISIKNPNKALKDYKDFRKKHNKLYSLRPDAGTVRKQMPKSFLHQTLISLHHPIWRSLHKHRSTIKGQSLAQSIHSANMRQERVRGVNEQDKRSKVAKISNLVMDVVTSMSNTRIKWEPTGTELMERMSAISGVSIDSDWYERHTTIRREKKDKDKLLLMFEAAGGKNMSSKTAQKFTTMSNRHIRGASSKFGGGSSAINIDDDDLFGNLNIDQQQVTKKRSSHKSSIKYKYAK